uniref:TGc domain-containing protein n=1 Tax=Bursaphelenchus xylophilus TaxID=6326 RepID=A0A1I7S6L3_BURXY
MLRQIVWIVGKNKKIVLLLIVLASTYTIFYSTSSETHNFNRTVIKEAQPGITRVRPKTYEAQKLWPEFGKTLAIKSGDCAGMANIFWRIAALYGLSLQTNRTAIIGAHFKRCGLFEKYEMTYYFPALSVLYSRVSWKFRGNALVARSTTLGGLI